MEFKILLYIVGGVIYLVYMQYKKLQKDALKRKAELQGEMKASPPPIIVETLKPLQRVKKQRQQLDAESARLREQNKMRPAKTPKPFFETPEHVTSVFTQRDNISGNSASSAVLAIPGEDNVPEEIDIRKMILYSELLRRPAW